MKAETPYIHLLERKRSWTPLEITKGKLLDGGEEVVQRALALRCLEIPVGSFVDEASKGDLPQGTDAKGCKELLLSNVEDETKHDLALNLCAAAHGVPERFEKEAARIQKAWLELDRHPILKAVVIERSIFFVLLPIFRWLGDTGLSSTQQDISRDEQTHTAANSLVCEALGLKGDKQINQLRKATVAWVLQSLDAEHENPRLSKNFWMKSSDMLYARGKAATLKETTHSRMPSFFEIRNENLPMYV